MDMILRVFGIAAVSACLLTAGTIGARFLHASSSGKSLRPRTSFAANADMPSPDTDIPLPPSSKRVYAIKQAGDPNAVMTMYATPRLSPAQVAEFYLDEMPSYGWREHELREQELNKHVEDIMLYFRGTGKECIIYVGSEGVGAAWTVMVRHVIIGGGK